MPDPTSIDVAILGGGPAGCSAASWLAQLGLSTLLVERALRQRVNFVQANLNGALPQLGSFDVVFLRNVMIYFNADTKRQVATRVISLLKPGGWLCIGHSESLNDITDAVRPVAPSIYRKP